MRNRRTITGVAVAAMLAAQLAPASAYAENPMGYRVLSIEQAARLPNKNGALGLDVAPGQQISDSGMNFVLMQVRRVQAGSTAAQAGLQRGAQVIAVDGRVFPSAAAFAAYVRAMPPGRRISIDYMPAGGGPGDAERVAVVVGKPGYPGNDRAPEPHAQAQKQPSGRSTRTRIGLAAAALLGCYYFGCFSGDSEAPSR